MYCICCLQIIQTITIVAIFTVSPTSLENASFVAPSVPAFEMQKATIEASHAALPPKQAGHIGDAITIPSEQVNNWWKIGQQPW